MAIEFLNGREQGVILQCMKAVAELIDEWEMHTRIGVTSQELQALIACWPKIDDRAQESGGYLAINNSLNEICHGLQIFEWANLVDATADEVRETYRNWLRLQNARGGIR